MNEIESYEKSLINMSPKIWATFLMDNAFVSGNKINVELAETFSRVGTLMDFKHFVCIDHVEAPEGSADAFLTYCGVLGYGVYLSKYYDQGLLEQLRIKANDPRLTVRQAVIKALQYIGRKNFRRLFKYMDEWKNGTPLEQRACLAAVCSSGIMKDQEAMLEALELLEWVTATFIEDINWDQNYKLLQDEVARCWSVLVAENPTKGKQRMERWMKERHPLVSSIMKKVY
ncbi:hypothetical protein [Fodinibius sp.]|uniref:hypothetical protein n=1 Tax=Fodinibius sp. TaxID=1872440 RepID=UPI002ACD4D39|nr:hypothetical protein [Fodinibius sp.]MDZ7660132.1 hypothetical protein [Fodinibius sp.]